MADMEERYKKYLEKAKAVIRSLDTKAGSPDVSVLRHQVGRRSEIASDELTRVGGLWLCWYSEHEMLYPINKNEKLVCVLGRVW